MSKSPSCNDCGEKAGGSEECELCSSMVCSSCFDHDNGLCSSCNQGMAENRSSKYGSSQQQQVCLKCGDVRKVYCEPFTKCDGDGCNRYICGECFDHGQGEFCDYCLLCGKCSNLLSCANCGTYRCCPKENDECGMCQCTKCKSGTCDDCESYNGETCAQCSAKIDPGWYIKKTKATTKESS